MKIARTLLFLANLARVMPVSPVMLVDVARHVFEHNVVAREVVERDVATAVTDRLDRGVPADQVTEAWLIKGLRTLKG